MIDDGLQTSTELRLLRAAWDIDCRLDPTGEAWDAKMVRLFKEVVTVNLDSYPTTLEEDRELLKESSSAGTERRHTAVRMVSYEKLQLKLKQREIQRAIERLGGGER